LTALGFIRSKLDNVVYKRGSKESFLIVGVYVDDLIIVGPKLEDINQFKL